MHTSSSIVANILRDKEQGWGLDYYKEDGKTCYDIIVAKLYSIIEIFSLSEKIKALLDHFDDYKETPFRTAKDIAVKEKEMKTSITVLGRKIHTLTSGLGNIRMPKSLSSANDILENYRYLQHLEKQRISHLQHVRNKYRIDGNEDEMRRDVQEILDMHERHRTSLVDTEEVVYPMKNPYEYSERTDENFSAW
jgi:hypothetical protein